MSGDLCSYDGRPNFPRLFFLNDSCTIGLTETIAINFLAPCELIMEQITAHWGLIPVTSEDITLWKDSGVGVLYDTVLRAMDPSAAGENTTDWACVIPFRFRKGDRVRVDFANTDDKDVGVEVILKQVQGVL